MVTVMTDIAVCLPGCCHLVSTTSAALVKSLSKSCTVISWTVKSAVVVSVLSCTRSFSCSRSMEASCLDSCSSVSSDKVMLVDATCGQIPCHMLQICCLHHCSVVSQTWHDCSQCCDIILGLMRHSFVTTGILMGILAAVDNEVGLGGDSSS